MVTSLESLRELLARGETDAAFELARRIAAGGDNDARWQALIVIGDYIPEGRFNGEIWSLVLDSCDRDEDMQTALGAVLLEHLLEYDFEVTIQRIRQVPTRRMKPFREVLKTCWRFGETDEQWEEVQRIINN